MTVTRAGATLALVALLVPMGLSAQRLPLPGTGRRGPARPAPLPPPIEPVARHLAYQRLRLAVESYPLISYVRAPGFAGGAITDWTTFGTGTRADYRVTPRVSLTMDLTSSFAGGPANVHTIEVGTRIRPERSERRAYPFIDLRLGYLRSSSGYVDAIGGEYAYPTLDEGGAFRYSSGFGGAGGVGVEYTLTRTLSLTTAASVMRTGLTTKSFTGASPGEHSYTMTLYRYTLGLRYNPVRLVRAFGTDRTQSPDRTVPPDRY